MGFYAASEKDQSADGVNSALCDEILCERVGVGVGLEVLRRDDQENVVGIADVEIFQLGSPSIEICDLFHVRLVLLSCCLAVVLLLRLLVHSAHPIPAIPPSHSTTMSFTMSH